VWEEGKKERKKEAQETYAGVRGFQRVQGLQELEVHHLSLKSKSR
jgi:hypothetical protein